MAARPIITGRVPAAPPEVKDGEGAQSDDSYRARLGDDRREREVVNIHIVMTASRLPIGTGEANLDLPRVTQEAR